MSNNYPHLRSPLQVGDVHKAIFGGWAAADQI